ncbi:MAG: MaoC family dehydratase N-terminal domain-containing protein [Proteobacteria bacterium]|nr:MaoC family dehydratase N-terminal domain-containing protein [Pseudomonadota bacterium]
MDQINFSAWENRVETRTGGLSAQLAAMAQATLGGGDRALGPGDVMPPLWHWFAFAPTTPTADLGRDGHPPLGDFLPPVRLERRMWAGGNLAFHAPLHVDEPLTRTSTIRKVTEKQGEAGPMVFVTVEHEIAGRNGRAITERQDIVYLPIPDSYTPPRKIAAQGDTVLADKIDIPPTLLFRYSALTFNAHRIHYDLPYATQVEHYPGLVVHGPLQATLLMDAATRFMRRAPDHFTFRGVHPMFAGHTMRILAETMFQDRLVLCTAATDGNGGHQGMQATAWWEGEA